MTIKGSDNGIRVVPAEMAPMSVSDLPGVEFAFYFSAYDWAARPSICKEEDPMLSSSMCRQTHRQSSKPVVGCCVPSVFVRSCLGDEKPQSLEREGCEFVAFG